MGTTLEKINFSYYILLHLITSYSSYFEGKKGISGNKTSFFLLMKHVDKSTQDWDVILGVAAAVMRSTSPSPLSTLTPSPVMRPFVPLEPSIAPVMLSQVEDILATSRMVQALHT